MGEAHLLILAALLAGATVLNAQYDLWNDIDNKGRLLTPDEGCGFQPPYAFHFLQWTEHWPWLGSVLLYSAEKKALTSACSATLITSRHALTTFNCVNEKVRYLRLGETPNKNASIIDIRVTRIELHPKAGWTNLRNNLAILFLERDVEFKKDSDRYRPACLPMRQSLLKERHGNAIYRLIRDRSFDISQPTAFKTANYTIVEREMCATYRTEPASLMGSGICVETYGVTGHEGDPVMIRVHEKGSFPVYQAGLAAYFTTENPAPILYLYPYMEWINKTVSGTATNLFIKPLLYDDEKTN